jgi:apolipoprotein D and lipocalin family protein
LNFGYIRKLSIFIALSFMTIDAPLSRAVDGVDRPPVSTVERVDLNRYLGLWYEISRIPNRFQDQCAADTTAHYGPRDDGRIDVVNTCTTVSGKVAKAEGIARIVDRETNAQLEVSFVELFGWRLFWGDYWILGLDADYSYAVIGSPNRKYGWILSRTRTLPPEKLRRARDILRANGYEPDDFSPEISMN